MSQVRSHAQDRQANGWWSTTIATSCPMAAE